MEMTQGYKVCAPTAIERSTIRYRAAGSGRRGEEGRYTREYYGPIDGKAGGATDGRGRAAAASTTYAYAACESLRA
ncbi:hypothetical protein VTO73DRAFT_11080 [Trametes versicolor]